MKIICIGDIHASGFNDDPIVENLPERLYYIKKTLDYIVDYGRRNDITEYVILGDIYHDKTIIYNTSQALMLEFFGRNSDLHFDIITGNHDLSSTGSNQKSAIEALGKLDNVNVYLYHIQVNEQLNGVFVPFTNNFIEELKSMPDNNMQIIFAHVGLNEAVLQSGLSRVDKIKISDLKDYKLAILGHYHRPQNLGNSMTDVWYAGSIIPRDWNDKNEEKRFLVVDTQTLQVESVSLAGIGVPMFREYVIDKTMDSDTVKAIITEATAARKNGDKVRIINKTKEKVKNDTTDMIVLEQQEVDVTNRGITVGQTKLQQCKKYLEIKGIPENEWDEYIKILNDNHIFDIVEKS